MKLSFVFMVAGITLLVGCALKQDVFLLDNHVVQLERQNRDFKEKSAQLQSLIEEKELELRKKSAGLHVELDQLREELQLLRGLLEESEYGFNQRINVLRNLDKQRQDSFDTINNRILRVENYLNFEIPESDIAVAADGRAEKDLSENEVYSLAKQAFDRTDFDASLKRFQELLKRFPKSENADNAQFWIGEIYYQHKWYEKAILEYQTVIEKYPQGNKVPAALLKQGVSFFNLKEKANARLILQELVKKYPKSNEAKIARQKLEGF